jgi:hypothetical protein
MRSRGQEASAGRLPAGRHGRLSLAAQVRHARHQDGLSVKEICRALSLSEFVVVEILAGREVPGVKVGRVDAPHEEGV